MVQLWPIPSSTRPSSLPQAHHHHSFFAAREPDFFFIYPLILQKYMVRKKNCKTIHLAPWGRWQGPTTVPHGVRSVCFQKFVIFCLNSDGGKLYMKIIAFATTLSFKFFSFEVIFTVK
jgi:hypothetical protein